MQDQKKHQKETVLTTSDPIDHQENTVNSKKMSEKQSQQFPQAKKAQFVNLKEKINFFEQSLLSVQNKQIHSKISLPLIDIQSTTKSNRLRRKIIKNLNTNHNDQISQSLLSPQNIFKSIYSCEYNDKTSDCNLVKQNLSDTSLLSRNCRSIGSLPIIQLKASLSHTSLQEPQSTSQSRILPQQKISPDHQAKKCFPSILKRNNENSNKDNQGSLADLYSKLLESKMEMQNELSNQKEINKAQRAEIDKHNLKENESLGMDELKQLRQRRKENRRRRRLQRMKDRIEELQQLEKEIPLIENANGEINEEKQKELLEKFNLQTTINEENTSIASQDDLLSKNSDDSMLIFGETPLKGDQAIAVNQLDDNQQILKKIPSFGYIKVGSDNQQADQQNIFSSSQTQSFKRTNKALTLKSIMEENSEYFDHIAGKCACGLCQCGKCQQKCSHSQKKPSQQNVQWQSTYSRQFIWNKTLNSLYKTNYTEIERNSIVPSKYSTQDYTSTFKNDFKTPEGSDFKRVLKNEGPPQESPLYTLTSYKENFVDWKVDSLDRDFKQNQKQTVVEGTPLVGESTMKRDYHLYSNLERTALAKPRDQCPLPTYQIIQPKTSELEQINSPQEQILKKKVDYKQVPSFNGQYVTSSAKTYTGLQNSCEGIKILQEACQRKILKYKKKLIEEIEKNNVK